MYTYIHIMDACMTSFLSYLLSICTAAFSIGIAKPVADLQEGLFLATVHILATDSMNMQKSYLVTLLKCRSGLMLSTPRAPTSGATEAASPLRPGLGFTFTSRTSCAHAACAIW